MSAILQVALLLVVMESKFLYSGRMDKWRLQMELGVPGKKTIVD